MLTHAGYDWIVVDTEHSPNEVPDVLLQLQIIQPGKTEPMVRVAWNDAVLIRRLLDIGTQTLLVPFVQNAEQAKTAVAATHYQPTRIRGVLHSARLNHFNKIKEYSCIARQEY